MTDKDPFNFDLRVSHRQEKAPFGTPWHVGRVRDVSTAVASMRVARSRASTRAPKSPDNLEDFKWFCREHVREYNLKWNFLRRHHRGRDGGAA